MRGTTRLIGIIILASVLTTQANTISGTVTDASNNRAIVGAIVTFQNLSGTNTFSDTSATGGAFALGAIPTYLTSGILAVSASGFAANKQILTGITPVDTVDIQLAPSGIGVGSKTISGTVTDAGTSGPVAGARLVLLLRAGLVTTTPMDTLVSGADGKFRFSLLSSGRYDLAATKQGYLDNTGNVDLDLTQADSLLVNIQLTPVGQRVGTVTGKVTTRDTSVALGTAKVLLTRTTAIGGIVTTLSVDSAQTGPGGLYAISGIPAATGYRLTVSDSGYVATATPGLFAIDSAATYTENFKLDAVIVPSCIINGSIIDSATLAALSGTSVVLRQLTAGNGGWTILDSTKSAANGSFLFTGLTVGTYSLMVERTDYVSYATPLNQAINLTRNPDTASVTIALVPVPRGSLNVFVEDNSNNALAGAAVSAIERAGSGQPAQTYNGITRADGWITFANAISGQYDLTVSESGFNTITRAGQTVGINANDTTRVTLQAATGAAKVVEGMVRTSSGAAIGQAVVILTAKAGGGTTLALVDTCKSDGAYAIAGIPEGYGAVSLSVTKSGYQPKDSAGIPVANDTTTVNFIMLPIVGVIHQSMVQRTAPEILAFQNGIRMLGFRPGVPIRITVFSLNGKVAAEKNIPCNAAIFSVPRFWPNQVVFLKVEQAGLYLRRKIVLP